MCIGWVGRGPTAGRNRAPTSCRRHRRSRSCQARKARRDGQTAFREVARARQIGSSAVCRAPSWRVADCLIVCLWLDRPELVFVCRRAKIVVIPNSAAKLAIAPRRARSAVAIFVGTAAYSPNREGIRWLAGKVWPLVRRTRPDARLIIVGDRTERLGVASRDSGVECRGFEADLAPFYAQAALAGVSNPSRGRDAN